MPNATDIFNAINAVNTSINSQVGATNSKLDQANTTLNAIKTSIDAVETAVEHVNSTLTTGFAQVIKLLEYADAALYHNAQQNDTIICELEKISKNTCHILNEEHTQTGLETKMEKGLAALVAMYACAHAECALALERERALKDQIEKCCPPKPPEPVCHYTPCPAPKHLEPPPQGPRYTGEEKIPPEDVEVPVEVAKV